MSNTDLEQNKGVGQRSNQRSMVRARMVNGSWEYEQQTVSRLQFGTSPELLQHLQNQGAPAPANTGSQEGSDQMQELTNQTRNVQIGSNNPFSRQTTSRNNPFLGPRHSTQGRQSAQPQRSTTPHPGQSRHTSSYQYPARSSVNPADHYDHGRALQQGGPVLDPRSISRAGAMTAAPRESRGSSSRSALLMGTKTSTSKPSGSKTHQAEGSTKVLQGRKAYWSEGLSNAYGEVLRFIVMRPHRRHSICLAIHTYNNLATTARGAKTTDHVVVYSSERPPPLVHGEDEIIRRRDPVKVTLEPKGEPLMPASRLNLAKVYTIEHNMIPVVAVGKLSDRTVERVRQYWLEVQGASFAAAGANSQPLIDLEEEDEEEEDED